MSWINRVKRNIRANISFSGRVIRKTIKNLITRHLVKLDPALSSYMKLVNPVVLTGDYDVYGKFVSTATATRQGLIGGIDDVNDYVKLETNDTMRIKASGSGAIILGSTNVRDGKLHTWLLQVRNSIATLYIDGVFESNSTGDWSNLTISTLGVFDSGVRYFNGTFCDVGWNDKSGVEDVTTTFTISLSESGTETSLEGNNALEYINIPDSNIEQFQLSTDKTQWDNISETPLSLPEIINIAPQFIPEPEVSSETNNYNSIQSYNTWNN